MRTLGLILSSLLLLVNSSCKTDLTDSESKSSRPIRDRPFQTTQDPFFPVQEWKNHAGGPLLEPYFLQNQLYSININLAEMPTSKAKVDASLSITDSSGKALAKSQITIRLRGYTSLNFPKKQYGITLVNDAGKDQAAALLSMPAGEEWVLSAPYNDKSLLRDVLTYNLSNLLGRHAPRTRTVSLTFTVPGQEPERVGLYVLTEKNTFGKGRIDILKKNAKGTSFLATFDHRHDGDNVVWGGRETEVILEYPALEKITPAQTEEFMAVFNDVENRVTAQSGPAWDNIFNERLDLSSAVDFFVMQELSRNIDGFRLSSPFYIPPQGKVFFGPLWDFNIAYGNATHENGVQYDGWRSQEKGVWFGPLLSHPVFCEAAKVRWADARADGTLSNDTIFNIIDKQAAIMAPLTAENFERWPSLGSYLWPNPYWMATWDEEKDVLKSWISLRTQWLDAAYKALNCSISGPSQTAPKTPPPPQTTLEPVRE